MTHPLLTWYIPTIIQTYRIQLGSMSHHVWFYFVLKFFLTNNYPSEQFSNVSEYAIYVCRRLHMDNTDVCSSIYCKNIATNQSSCQMCSYKMLFFYLSVFPTLHVCIDEVSNKLRVFVFALVSNVANLSFFLIRNNFHDARYIAIVCSWFRIFV